MKRFINSVLAVCLLAGTAAAEPDKKEETPLCAQTAAEGLKAWDKKLAYLDAGFEQTTSYDGVLISASKGRIYYSQTPRLLRLDTLDEEGNPVQSAVTDKKIILMLDEKGRRITTLDWQAWQEGQPNKALFDFGNYAALLARHEAVLFEETPQNAVLQLTPKTGEEYRLFLTLGKTDFFPQVITIESDLMRTEAKLLSPEKNKKLSAALFKEVTKK